MFRKIVLMQSDWMLRDEDFMKMEYRVDTKLSTENVVVEDKLDALIGKFNGE